MKKALKYFFLTLAAVSISAFLIYQLAPNWVKNTAVDLLYPTVTIEKKYVNTVSIEVPKVYELMYIACALTETFKKDDNLISARTPQYRSDVEAHFSKYNAHPLVNLLESKLKGHAYSQLQPAIRLFALNYDLKQDNRLHENEIFHVNSILIKLFRSKIFYYPDNIRLIEDFAQETGFYQFYREHEPYYQSLTDKYQKLCKVEDLWKWVESRFPETYDSYRIIFSPLTGGFHNTIPGLRDPKSNLKQTWMFVSPPPNTDLYTLSDHDLLILTSKVEREVFTEIDHNYVNPISDKYITEIEEAMPDYRTWNHQKRGYSNSLSTFNEYMTWSLFSLYVLDHYPEDLVEEIISSQENFMVERRKFIHYKSFDRKMIELYEGQKDKGQSVEIESLYPSILKWVAEQSVQEEE